MHVSTPCLATALLAACASPPHALVDHHPTDLERWTDDLLTLSSELRSRHNDPFHSVTEPAFEAAVQQIRSDLAQLRPKERVARFVELASMLGEAHTYLEIPDEGPLAFGRLPVELEWFADGIFVIAAPTDSAGGRALGARLLAIGDTDIDTALRRLRPFVAIDNEMTFRFLAPRRLTLAELLRTKGIVQETGVIPLHLLDRDGKRIVWEVEPALQVPKLVSVVSPEERSPDLRRLDEPHWFEFRPESNTLYVQLNQVRDAPDASLHDFAARVSKAIDAHEPKRVALDLRHNIGGNARLGIPLVRALVDFDAERGPGHLFVVIGPGSISATVVLARQLSRWTRAIFDGEPTGSRPNQYGDNEKRKLPNTGLELMVATAYYQTGGPYDYRPWIAPDVHAPRELADYLAGRDPAMTAILSYSPPPDLGTVLRSAYADRGIDGARSAHREFHLASVNRYAETERATRLFARGLLRDGAVADAVEVYRWNVDRYPDRARVYIGLGDALAQAEDAEAARAAYRQASARLRRDTTLYPGLRRRLGAAIEARQAALK